MFKLQNQVKHYEWGSPSWIPRLLTQPGLLSQAGLLTQTMGTVNGEGRPWAELWMGSHPGAPSQVITAQGETGLGELIAGDPVYHLGKKTAEQYGGLPFLFKLLAAEKPLSIQAHPNLAQAREGFDRENRAGLAMDAPSRNYKDANHKPEIICAITPFTGMCGFRSPDEISRLLGAFLAPPFSTPPPASLRDGFAPLLQALAADNTAPALRKFLTVLFELSAPVREELTGYILKNSGTAIADKAGISAEQWKQMRRFAELYPGDPALISPLYLNLFSLEPGEAIFLRAGILHAYLYGFGVELMANSDNVLRGGLTPKHVDVPELMKVLEFSPMKPEILKPGGPSSGSFKYPSACGEFSLSVMRGCGGETVFDGPGPGICIVIDGEALIRGEGEMILKKGESVFIPAGEIARKPPVFKGNYSLYAATVPVPVS